MNNFNQLPGIGESESVVVRSNADRALLTISLFARMVVAIYLAIRMDPLEKTIPFLFLIIFAGPYIVPLLKAWKAPIWIS